MDTAIWSGALVAGGVGIFVTCEAASVGIATPVCVLAGGEVTTLGLIGAYVTYREAKDFNKP